MQTELQKAQQALEYLAANTYVIDPEVLKEKLFQIAEVIKESVSVYEEDTCQ